MHRTGFVIEVDIKFSSFHYMALFISLILLDAGLRTAAWRIQIKQKNPKKPGCVPAGGRMGEGEIMFHAKYSDFKFCEDRIDRLILTQPSATVGMTKDGFLKGGQSVISDVVMSTLKLCHVGNLCFYHGNSTNELIFVGPNEFNPCGGMLTFEDKPIKHFTGQNSAETHITCSKCDIHLAIDKSTFDLSAIIFHLMLKQMVPDLPMCNYIDCGASKEEHSISGTQLRKIQELGLISLVYNNLYGKWKLNGQDELVSDHGNNAIRNLAFMLIPGMRTLKDFDGFDMWLIHLLTVKFRTVKMGLESEYISEIVGPKSA